MLKKAKVVPIKSLYNTRQDVKRTLSEVESSLSVASVFEVYDAVYTNCSVFSLLSNDDIKTDMSPWFKFEYRNCSGTKSPVKKVGLAWASALKAPDRSVKYALSLEDVADVVKEYSGRLSFYAPQSNMSGGERRLCVECGIIEAVGVDLYNDFVASAEFYSSLDAVVGVSTLNTELAAAVGPVFYHIANSPDIFYMRTGSLSSFGQGIRLNYDQMSSNTITVPPVVGYGASRSEINKSCLRDAFNKILS